MCLVAQQLGRSFFEMKDTEGRMEGGPRELGVDMEGLSEVRGTCSADVADPVNTPPSPVARIRCFRDRRNTGYDV